MSELQNRVIEAAQRRAEEMLATGDRLSDLAHEQVTLGVALADVEANYKRAWAEATKAGWAPAQLKTLGFKEPAGQPRRRPRKRAVTPEVTPDQHEPAASEH